MDWRHFAACRDHEPELFFPVSDTGPALLQIREAKAVCRSCPVLDRCLEWGRDEGMEHGIWGGLSEGEHRMMRRRGAHSTPLRSNWIDEDTGDSRLA
jgi:WhiB family transcriptional regulator, redox-sensing transcriptional regulator